MGFGLGFDQSSIAAIQQASPSVFSTYEDLTGAAFEQGAAIAVEPYNGATRLGIWMQLKRGVWARERYDIDTPTLSMSRRQISIVPTMALYRAKDMGQTGAWNAATTTSTTGSSQRHVSNTAIATATVGRKLTQALVPYDSQAYDLFISVTKRTAGGFLKVTIDGAQTLVNEIVDPQSLGFKAINCYGPVDNTRRQFVKVASGLTGNHTLVVECVAGVPTGSSAVTTGTVTVEAALITSELQDARTRPLHWAAGQVIAIGDEREYGGRYYCATTAGTTGATPPTHGSGNVSDGTVTWAAAGTIYASGWIDVRELDYASEVEGAIVLLTYNNVTFDVGGQTHGNDFASNRVIKVDGVVYNYTIASTIVFGSRAEITETLTWKDGSAVVIANGTRSTVITPGKTVNNKTVTAAVGFTIATAYGAMLPLCRWDGTWARGLFTHVIKPDGAEYQIDTFHTSAPNAQSLGRIYSAALRGSMGTVGNLVYAIDVKPRSVKNYSNAGAEAFIEMNVDNTASPAGALDWKTKLYFARAKATAEIIAVNDVLTFESEHRLTAA